MKRRGSCSPDGTDGPRRMAEPEGADREAGLWAAEGVLECRDRRAQVESVAQDLLVGRSGRKRLRRGLLGKAPASKWCRLAAESFTGLPTSEDLPKKVPRPGGSRTGSPSSTARRTSTVKAPERRSPALVERSESTKPSEVFQAGLGIGGPTRGDREKNRIGDHHLDPTNGMTSHVFDRFGSPEPFIFFLDFSRTHRQARLRLSPHVAKTN